MELQKPNYTVMSNDFIDKHIANLTGAEVKIFLAIARKTIGCSVFHNKTEKISISQFEEMTGLSNKQIIKSCKSLQDKGFITAIKSVGEATEYQLK